VRIRRVAQHMSDGSDAADAPSQDTSNEKEVKGEQEQSSSDEPTTPKPKSAKKKEKKSKKKKKKGDEEGDHGSKEESSKEQKQLALGIGLLRALKNSVNWFKSSRFITDPLR